MGPMAVHKVDALYALPGMQDWALYARYMLYMLGLVKMNALHTRLAVYKR